MDRPSTIMFVQVGAGDRVQGHSRFLGFGDELRIPLQVIYLLQTTEAEKISSLG